MYNFLPKWNSGLLHRPLVRVCLCLFVSVCLFIFPALRSAQAHAYSASYTTINIDRTQTGLVYSLDELSVIELTAADANGNGMLDEEEFQTIKDKLMKLIQDHLTLKINGEEKAWTSVEEYKLERSGDATKVYLTVVYPAAAAGQTVSLTDTLYDKDTKTNYVDLLTVNYGQQKSTAALSGKSRTWNLLMTEADWAGVVQAAPPEAPQQAGDTGGAGQAADQPEAVSGWFSFFKLGMNHILTGYDHLLFLFSLLIARQSFKQYATVITAFTVAHTITLTLTVLGIIDISPRIVEPAIAISICYVALDNMLRKNVSHRWVLTFMFGLIHGMGFADLLKDMQLPNSELATDLISFNIGIETVQLVIVLVLLPLLLQLHRWKHARRLVYAGSSAALVLGGLWLIERIV
ncbi:HupE/UreJ family protein [Paenibacillus athensensis]|uniref:EF-hand domain-containing protein n=1 Tax=Paenibacillus athensensis TaxID=1967502 RepID=A0A4Y8PZ10_9BACL|nr:HupE/UreJ family protein [Paenibacillus athensensis]MCD1260444.1 HupE/UreJ family protein [Paenibacillus athensensis]